MAIRMVFDIESVGLHGEGFAVGFVVMDRDREVDSGFAWCHPTLARGSESGRKWVDVNVLPHFRSLPTHRNPAEVRDYFWRAWRVWADKGATLWADCAWPVEGRFLAACVEDDHPAREWSGPYPLHEIATAIYLAGGDPLAHSDRADDEPAHHPLADARVSARQLVAALSSALL